MLTNLKNQPICVDLDGSLIKNDLSWESLILFIKQYPLKIITLISLYFKGLPALKRYIASRVEINPEHLPYNTEVLTFLKNESKRGIKIYLATGSDNVYAQSVAKYLGVFEKAWGTDKNVNLTRHNKARLLKDELGDKQFIYIGDSTKDFPVWEVANSIIAINPSKVVKIWIDNSQQLSQFVFNRKPLEKVIFDMVRPHQWVKNLLIFLPFILNIKLISFELTKIALISFVCFCMTASAIYIINDILDLHSDRDHPKNKDRALASGKISIVAALNTSGLLILSSLLFSLLVPHLTLMLVGYIVITTLYSIEFKKIAFIDVLCLSLLYVYRILTGCVASGLGCSNWILSFSFFVFLNLAILKRYTEIAKLGSRRGYQSEDLPLLQQSGLISGFLSVIVFALYIESEKSHSTFTNPSMLWLMIPALTYFVLIMWQAGVKKSMDYDPILYVLKDKKTIFTVVYTAIVFLIAL